MLKQKSSEYFENFILNKDREFEKSNDIDNKIKIKIDLGNKDEPLESLINHYILFENLTYNTMEKGTYTSPIFFTIKDGIKIKGMFDNGEIVFKELIDYYKYVLRGFRIN